MESGGWKSLAAVSNVGTDAPLLIKHSFTATSYSIYLTDLSQIWSESLDRRQIIRRALDAETSIDPSEGTGQLNLLLQKIQGVFTGQHEGNLVLSWSGKDKDLLLEISASLPAPLRSLEWRLHLVPAPPALLTTELLLPCLRQQVFIISEAKSLLESLKEKDHVINRLVDRLQSSGIEMSAVFPGAAALRSTNNANSREVAVRTMKGLGEFDVSKWRKDFRASFSPPAKTLELVQTVFSSNIVGCPEINTEYDEHEDSMWWEHLKNRRPSGDQTPTKPPVEAHPISSPTSSKDSGENAGFQLQVTPHRVKSGSSSNARYASPIGGHQRRHQSSPEPSRVRDATTDDDEDDEVKIRRPESTTAREMPSNEYRGTAHAELPARSKTLIASPKKLGLVGGMHRKPSTWTEIPFVKSPSPAGKQYTGLEADTAGESQASEGRDLSNPNSPVKAKSKLGFIGGRSKGSQANSGPADVGDKSPVLSLGRGRDIDDNGARKTSVVRKSRGPVGLTSIVPAPPMPPRESSQDRADKKRDLLKRQLEEKAKVSTKKKRKF